MTLLLIKIHSETNIFLSSKGIWEREKRGFISYLSAWGNDQLLCLKILHSRKNEICLWKIGNERRDVLGDSRKRYHRPWTEIGKYWPHKEPIRLDLSFLYVSLTSVDTFLLIRLWQQSNSIHRSKASVLVQNLLNSNALNMWWKENFRVTRETYHFICTAVAPVIQRQDTILRAGIPVETRTAIGFKWNVTR